jgi:hypothetical protein
MGCAVLAFFARWIPRTTRDAPLLLPVLLVTPFLIVIGAVVGSTLGSRAADRPDHAAPATSSPDGSTPSRCC